MDTLASRLRIAAPLLGLKELETTPRSVAEPTLGVVGGGKVAPVSGPVNGRSMAGFETFLRHVGKILMQLVFQNQNSKGLSAIVFKENFVLHSCPSCCLHCMGAFLAERCSESLIAKCCKMEPFVRKMT